MCVGKLRCFFVLLAVVLSLLWESTIITSAPLGSEEGMMLFEGLGYM